MLQSLNHQCGPLLDPLQRAFLYRGAQHCAQYSSCGLTSAEQRERITSLELLATLCLTQPTVLLATFAPKAHWRFVSNLCAPAPFLPMCSPAGQPQTVLVDGVAPPQAQSSALPFVEWPDIPVCPILQPVGIPLDGSTAIWCITHPSQFCIICKPEGTVCPIFQVTNEDAKQHWTQIQVLASVHLNTIPRRNSA